MTNLDENFDGPEIEIYPSEYRQLKGKWRRKHEPMIYWGNLGKMIGSIAFSLAVGVPVYMAATGSMHWLLTTYVVPLLP